MKTGQFIHINSLYSNYFDLLTNMERFFVVVFQNIPGFNINIGVHDRWSCACHGLLNANCFYVQYWSQHYAVHFYAPQLKVGACRVTLFVRPSGRLFCDWCIVFSDNSPPPPPQLEWWIVYTLWTVCTYLKVFMWSVCQFLLIFVFWVVVELCKFLVYTFIRGA